MWIFYFKKLDMYWNYRVLCTKEYGEEFFTINEVYYDDKTKKPISYIEHTKGVGSESKKSLKWQLKEMKKSLKKPVLSKDNFPKKYKK